MKIRLVARGSKEWPRCFYDQSLRCGEPGTGALKGYGQADEINRSWHVADMCNCPSCPLRCAIRDALWQDSKDAA